MKPLRREGICDTAPQGALARFLFELFTKRRWPAIATTDFLKTFSDNCGKPLVVLAPGRLDTLTTARKRCIVTSLESRSFLADCDDGRTGQSFLNRAPWTGAWACQIGPEPLVSPLLASGVTELSGRRWRVAMPRFSTCQRRFRKILVAKYLGESRCFIVPAWCSSRSS